jgi:hypothetical protein
MEVRDDLMKFEAEGAASLPVSEDQGYIHQVLGSLLKFIKPAPIQTETLIS